MPEKYAVRVSIHGATLNRAAWFGEFSNAFEKFEKAVEWCIKQTKTVNPDTEFVVSMHTTRFETVMKTTVQFGSRREDYVKQ